MLTIVASSYWARDRDTCSMLHAPCYNIQRTNGHADATVDEGIGRMFPVVRGDCSANVVSFVLADFGVLASGWSGQARAAFGQTAAHSP